MTDRMGHGALNGHPKREIIHYKDVYIPYFHS
jgi:hypothetical protein